MRTVTLAVAGALTLGLIGATPALAKDGDIERSGSCSEQSDWELKLSEEDGGIEVEFEVDQNVTGHKWKVVMRQDGDVFYKKNRTTKGASGSFTTRDVVDDTAGGDKIVAKATNLSTDEVCKGTATF